MAGDYVHLHLHTQCSLLDGANRMKDLLRHVHEQEMPAVAVTDRGNMLGVYDLQTTGQGAEGQADPGRRGVRGPRVALRPGAGQVVRGRGMRFYDDQCYVKSAEEMTELFRPHSLEAGTNTVALAARVEPETIVHGGLERLRLARKDYIPLHGVWE